MPSPSNTHQTTIKQHLTTLTNQHKFVCICMGSTNKQTDIWYIYITVRWTLGWVHMVHLVVSFSCTRSQSSMWLTGSVHSKRMALSYSPFSVTCILMLCEALPALLLAKHVYSPESLGSALVICSRSPSIMMFFPLGTSDVSGIISMLFSNQLISGLGVPVAWHVSSIVLPGSTWGVIGGRVTSGGSGEINGHLYGHTQQHKSTDIHMYTEKLTLSTIPWGEMAHVHIT